MPMPGVGPGDEAAFTPRHHGDLLWANPTAAAAASESIAAFIARRGRSAESASSDGRSSAGAGT